LIQAWPGFDVIAPPCSVRGGPGRSGEVRGGSLPDVFLHFVHLIGDLAGVAEVLFEDAALGTVFDLAFLFGSEFLAETLPGTGAGVAGHDAAEGMDLGDDVGEAELLDLGFDLSGRFITDRGFSEIGLAAIPADIEAGGAALHFVRNAAFVA